MASIMFIRRLIAVQHNVVKYDHEADPGFRARCPMCEFCGLEAKPVEITSTVGEVRYCSCTACFTTFRAVGLTAKEIKLEQDNTPDPPKKYKGKPSKRKRKR